MSLLGRLEDLSLTDIIQIVFLSRRTGVLEIIDPKGRYTVLFKHGLLANASSPDSPDLGSWLLASGVLSDKALTLLRTTEEAGVPTGSAAIEMNFMTREALAESVQRRISEIIIPLLSSREGEFNFILSDAIGPIDAEYDTDAVLGAPGIPPHRIIGGEGEKIKPLRGLEETMKAGKALLRGVAAPRSPQEAISELAGLSEPDSRADPEAERSKEAVVVPFPQREEAPFDLAYDDVGSGESLETLLPAGAEGKGVAGKEARDSRVSGATLRIASGEDERQRKEATDRNVVLFERDPLVRVAARRAFNRRAVRSFQFGTMADTRDAIGELLRENHFFVTFLELTPDDRDQESEGDSIRLMHSIKKKNRHLPIVVIDGDADLRRRHRLLKEGADLYLTRPSEDHLQPGLVEEELALFADELVLFAERAFSDWEQIAGTFDPNSDVGKQFYDIARKEKLNRSFALLKHLISELSNPNDITQVSNTILHLAAEYLERGILLVIEPAEIVGLGGFGTSGEKDDLKQRGPGLRMERSEPSILTDVAASGLTHRGKLRRTPGNERLIASLGVSKPTEVVVLPIRNHDEVIGLLYGDNGESRSQIDDINGLEIFLSQAGFAFGNAVTTRRKQRLQPEEGER
ncbi:MAG TPA: response regulator [Thermoanaerobaculia bacterium]|nr:response regulator [Thermoanaerobaculia bacterium]